MLILTRKTDQGIVLDGRIVVRVLGVDGDRVKLGITAPLAVVVLREELCNAVREENRRATQSPGSHSLDPLRRTIRRHVPPASA